MFEKVKWNRIAKKIEKLSPEIYSALSSLCEKHGDEFYLLRYSYGEKIIAANGAFQLPNELMLSEASQSTVEDLDYAGQGIPLGVITSGQCELFIETFQSSIANARTESIDSLRVYRAGDFIGFENLLQDQYQADRGCSEKSFQMTSGARTAFITAGVKNSSGFNRLRKTFSGLNRLDKPNTIYDHWNLFRVIANHPEFKSPWHTEIILFPKKLANAIKASCLGLTTDNAKLMNLIFNKANSPANEVMESALWGNLLGSYSQYPYTLIEKSKQILLGGLGRIPLYHISHNDEAGPFLALSEVFSEAYQWEKYAPIIMKPTYVDWLENSSAYCTLNLAEKNSVFASCHKSSASDAVKIKQVISQIMKRADKFSSMLENSTLRKISKLNITFHHYDVNKTDEMLPSDLLFKDEKEISRWSAKGKQPAYSNSFLRCCAKITRIRDSVSSEKILNKKLETIEAWEV